MDERIKSAISSLLNDPAIKNELSLEEAYYLARMGLSTVFPNTYDFDTTINILCDSEEDLRQLLSLGIELGIELGRS